MRRGDVLAIIQAGGEGARMDVLTRERAKPVLPYAGTHRLVDFAMSAMAYSEFVDIWVSVEYQVASIDQYLAGGRPWSLDRNRGGFRRVVPETGSGPKTEEGFAYGNADLLLRMSADIEEHGATATVVASADHVFNADLRPVVDRHLASGADLTLVTAEVSKKEASAKVALVLDDVGEVQRVEAKAPRPSTGVVATEIFVYKTSALVTALRDLRRDLMHVAEGDDSGLGDFGDHLLPYFVEHKRVRTEPIEGYWRDMGRPAVYLMGHRDLLDGKVDAFDHHDRPVMTHWADSYGAHVRAGAEVTDSILAPGCDVRGTVVRSVLGHGVVVEEGARVEDCVLFDRVQVGAGARVSSAIADDESRFERGCTVGSFADHPAVEDDEVVLVGRGATVGAGVALEPGSRLEPGSSA